jgi:ABC-type transport system substrate-binding protein
VTRSPGTSDPLEYLSAAGSVDRYAPLAELIGRARTDTDLASREQIVTDAQRLLADRAVAIPLWQGTAAVVTRPGVARVTTSPFLRLWLLRPPQ